MKLRILSTILCLILCLCLAGTGLFAASNILLVKCVDQEGNPLNKVEVAIQALRGEKTKDEKTKSNGIAEFKKLDDDVYRVWAHHEGYAPAFAEFYLLEGGASETITLSFTAGSDREFYFENPSILQQSTQLMIEGANALQANQLDQAEAKLKESLEMNPSEPTAMLNMGFVHLQRGNFDEAEKILTDASHLMDLFLKVSDTPQLTDQKNQIDQTLKSMPVQKIAYEVDQAMRSKDFERAATKLNELIAIHPQNANAHYMLAIALTQTQKMDKAEVSLAKAIELDPNNDAFHSLKKRIADLRVANERNRQKALLADVQKARQEERYDEAVQLSIEALSDVDEEFHAALWTEQAQAYMGMEKWQEGIQSYRKSLELGGSPADDGIFKLGEDFVRRGKQAEARIAFQEVLKINPNYAEAYYQLGMDTFYELEDAFKAKELLEKYIEIGQEEANVNNAKNVLAVIEMQQKSN